MRSRRLPVSSPAAEIAFPYDTLAVFYVSDRAFSKAFTSFPEQAPKPQVQEHNDGVEFQATSDDERMHYLTRLCAAARRCGDSARSSRVTPTLAAHPLMR